NLVAADLLGADLRGATFTGALLTKEDLPDPGLGGDKAPLRSGETRVKEITPHSEPPREVDLRAADFGGAILDADAPAAVRHLAVKSGVASRGNESPEEWARRLTAWAAGHPRR